MALVYKEWRQRKTARLKNWNYAASAAYFITIGTANRIQFLGEITKNEDSNTFIPTQIGIEANKQWVKIPEIRPDMNIKLGAYQLMPNHLHGIITIGINQYNEHFYFNSIESENPLEIKGNYLTTPNKFGPISHNLPAILRGFKSKVSKFATENNIDFKWQGRFNDHIIRSKIEYDEITEYIIQNPTNWEF
jgi:putative transposase